MKRICKKCHKPSGSQVLCKTCEKVQSYHDLIEEQRLDELRKSGWVPPEVKTIRNKVEAMK